jgi:hypothetical protein
MKIRISQICLLTAVFLSCLSAAAPANAVGNWSAARVRASAVPGVVLVNQPARSVCVGRTFRVGVWFQGLSGGSRAYRIAIYGPRHTRFFYRHGRAPSAHWRFWKIRAGRVGRYRTVYREHPPNSRKWTAYRAYTRARRC